MNIGRLVATRSVSDLMDEKKEFRSDVNTALSQYLHNDWGVTCKEDSELNDRAVKDGERVLASYDTIEGKIWIITEWDRSYTTILFPSEY